MRSGRIPACGGRWAARRCWRTRRAASPGCWPAAPARSPHRRSAIRASSTTTPTGAPARGPTARRSHFPAGPSRRSVLRHGPLRPRARRRPPKPERLQPTRIHSIGDSITTAFDSNFILENPSESWVNGFFGFFQQLFGFENVKSHNQRADAAFGVTSNVNGSVNGADMNDMDVQAVSALGSTPFYVTVGLGGNDICQDSASQVPAPLDYILDYIDGVFVLDPGIWGQPGGLTPGATIYTVSVPDIKQLYDVGKDQTGLFGFDCEAIWTTTLIGFPCGSMLSPLNTEQDRLALQAVNLRYNLFLRAVTNAVNNASPNVYWEFTMALWNLQIQGDDISSIDCFHPSSDGQRKASAVTWANGPFSAF
jgi:lysophospholipase L1-like esterase